MIDAIDTAELEQRSLEWRMARCGAVTASKVSDVIKTINGGKAYSAKRANYLDMIVAERITGKPQDWKEVKSLTDRAEMEPDARACYSFYTGNEVSLVGFVQHPSIERAGASPDGIVRRSGMIEIKCLDAGNHLKLFSGDDSVMLEYLPQVHFGMACTGRKWCDFVAFNPTMPEEIKMFRRRIERDEKVIAAIESEVRKFIAEVDTRVAHIFSRNGGPQ
jgi:hypothetical protein